MNKIIIIGTTGAGKTTLARKLAAIYNLKIIELDDLYWNKNWTSASDIEFEQRIITQTPKENWVMTGNYTRFHHLTWDKADTLVWLDYPFIIHFWHLLKRTLQRLLDKKEICNGNKETWHHVFSRKSIFIWLFKTYKRRRKENNHIFNTSSLYPHLTKIRLSSPSMCNQWLQETTKTGTKNNDNA